MVRTLEVRVPRAPIASGEAVAGIIVLGGDRNRLNEGLKLASEFPQAKLMLAGGGQPAEAFVRGTGIGEERLIFESKSTTTFENAVFARALIKPKGEERWLLVTSAWHMPRALGCFRKAGLGVLPWPVERREPSPGVRRMAEREWLKLLAYWVLGRTDSILPSVN
jgi:uncharacterized SAM-binding protein YcdF (DUF218 family)